MAKKKKTEDQDDYGNKELELKVDELMSIEVPQEVPKEGSPEQDAIAADTLVVTAPLLEDAPEKKDKPAKTPKKEKKKSITPITVVEDVPEEPEPDSETESTSEEPAAPIEPEEDLDLEDTIEDLQAKIIGTEKQEPTEISQPIDPETTESSDVISESDAIDDIVAQESDNIMNVEDQQRSALNQPKKASGFGKIGASIASLFTNKKKRRILLSIIFLAAIGLSIWPTTRYYLLNTAGVRSSSSIKVLDEKTLQPLKNVEVSIGTSTAKTDKEGYVDLKNIKLGPQQVVIKKPAFAENRKTVVIGWGSNPLGEFKLKPVGSHYNFILKDLLSDQPIKEAEIETEDGQANASANEKGEVSLVVEDTKSPEIKVKVTSEGLREEKLALDRNDKQTKELKMVPFKKHAFVSKRSGKYDLYSVYIDGKDEQKILTGSGYEKPDNLMIVPALDSSNVAFVTTRDNNRNKDGFLLSSLYVIDVNDKNNKVITRSERIQVIGWFGSRLVYVKATEGASAEDTNRHKLISYDTKSGTEKELASANYFNDVLAASGDIYFAPTSFKLSGSVGLFKIKPDGSGKQTIINQEAWNILRQGYSKLNISVGQQWYEYNLDEDKLSKLPGAPATTDSKVIVDNSDKHSAVVDQRDGKGVLLLYDAAGKKDKELTSGSGLVNPIYWLDNQTIILRIANSNETADYAISTKSGDKKKITNVTNTAGVDRWYYY